MSGIIRGLNDTRKAVQISLCPQRTVFVECMMQLCCSGFRNNCLLTGVEEAPSRFHIVEDLHLRICDKTKRSMAVFFFTLQHCCTLVAF